GLRPGRGRARRGGGPAADAQRRVHLAPERDDDEQHQHAEPDPRDQTDVPGGLCRAAHPHLEHAQLLFLRVGPRAEGMDFLVEAEHAAVPFHVDFAVVEILHTPQRNGQIEQNQCSVRYHVPCCLSPSPSPWASPTAASSPTSTTKSPSPCPSSSI